MEYAAARLGCRILDCLSVSGGGCFCLVRPGQPSGYGHTWADEFDIGVRLAYGLAFAFLYLVCLLASALTMFMIRTGPSRGHAKGEGKRAIPKFMTRHNPIRILTARIGNESKAQDASDSLYRKDPKVYPRDVKGSFASLRKLAVIVLAGFVLHTAVDQLGWSSVGTLRSSRPKVLYSGSYILATGFYIPDPDVDHCRSVAVFCYGCGRAALVWLCLPANRLDRSVFVDGALG